MNLCRSCGEDFNTVTVFNMHRVGKHEYTYSEGALMEPPVDDGRRCMSRHEMLEAGLSVNSKGKWWNAA